MKKAKKLLVTLLVLTFVLSIMGTGFAATSTTTSSSSQAPEVVRAQALGILKGDEKGNLNLDQAITRAEALALIIRISGLEASADLMKGQTKFTDVNSDAGLQWATGYINLGVGQGIINGYPDGTFKGRNTVTYAEMAKLLLYAMNYGVTVEGTVWPAGVMGKADDLGLLDGVSVSPNVPATRGAVVKMIDNSLTVKHLKQTGYGDLKSYEEGTDTFLSKMNVDEIDCTVTNVDTADYKITVKPVDSDQPISGAKTYTVLDKTVDIESLLGMEATVWANDDDEIFYIDPNLDDVKVDVISDVDTDNNKIDLKIADKTYKVDANADIYINGDADDINGLAADMYGSFRFDGSTIVAINVKNFDVNNGLKAGLVKSVDDNLITYYDEAGNENEIDLDDPDDGYVISLNGKAIQPDDIKANDVIYVADYNDMYHIIVVRDTVSGKLERVKDDSVQIAGKSYDTTDDTTYSPDENDNIYPYASDDSKLEDMLGSDTTAILDLGGDVRHVMSSVETTSDEFYGIALKVDDYNDVIKVLVGDESKSYDVNLDDDITDNAPAFAESGSYPAHDANSIKDLGDLKPFVNDSKDQYAVVSFTLDKDGVINALTVYALGTTTGDDSIAGEVKVTSFDKNDDTITAGGKKYIVNSDTTIYDNMSDQNVVKWDDIKDKTSFNNVYAIIVSDSGKAKLVVFTQNFDSIKAEDTYLGVILDKYKDSDGDWAVTVSQYGGSEVDYKVNDKADQNVGDLVLYTLNSDNELTVAGRVYDGSVVDPNFGDPGVTPVSSKLVVTKTSNSITIWDTDSDNDGKVDDNEKVTYSLSSKTLYFDVTGDNGPDYEGIDTAAYRDIKAGSSKVSLMVDGGLVEVVFIEE